MQFSEFKTVLVGTGADKNFARVYLESEMPFQTIFVGRKCAMRNLHMRSNQGNVNPANEMNM